MDVMLIFDVVIAIFGVYMIGAALKMKKTGKISSAVINVVELLIFLAAFLWFQSQLRKAREQFL